MVSFKKHTNSNFDAILLQFGFQIHAVVLFRLLGVWNICLKNLIPL